MHEIEVQARRGPAQRIVLFVLVVTIMNVVVACSLLGGGDGDPAAQTPGDGDGGQQPAPAGATTLTCSQECADRGQCGESADRGQVVLLSADQPAVAATEHELAVAAGSSVNVVDARSVTVVEETSGLEFPINFYRVFIPERNTEAWVAGWCVLNPQSQ